MTQEPHPNVTAEVSNEQLYQEIRRLHRRLLAAAGLVLTGVGGGLYIINPLAAIPPVIVSLATLVLVYYLHEGKFARVARLLTDDPPEPEPALEDRLGNPFGVGDD